MDDAKPEYLVPALIGGAASGVLLMTPFINLCCCLWLIPGGVLAAWVLAARTGPGLKGGDGAVVGALTGIVAAVVDAFLGLTPLQSINRSVMRTMADRMAEFSGAQLPQLDRLKEQLAAPPNYTVAGFLIGLFVLAAVLALVGLLGGVIGVAVFGAKKPSPPPRQPPAPPQGHSDAT
jgi:hypothetical protein